MHRGAMNRVRSEEAALSRRPECRGKPGPWFVRVGAGPGAGTGGRPPGRAPPFPGRCHWRERMGIEGVRTTERRLALDPVPGAGVHPCHRHRRSRHVQSLFEEGSSRPGRPTPTARAEKGSVRDRPEALPGGVSASPCWASARSSGRDLHPHRRSGRQLCRAGDHLQLRPGGDPVRPGRPVLRRDGRHDPRGRLGLRLFLRHHGGNHRLGHRLGPGAGVCLRRRDRGQRLVQLPVLLVHRTLGVGLPRPGPALHQGAVGDGSSLGSGQQAPGAWNLPASLVALLVCAVLYRGITQSAWVNSRHRGDQGGHRGGVRSCWASASISGARTCTRTRPPPAWPAWSRPGGR